MKIRKIEGAAHTDERGRLVFFNEFSMEAVKRFYEINPSSTTIIRAWQGHLLERKWFYCCEGTFVVNLIALDKQGNLRPDISVAHFVLDRNEPFILEVPGGFASGFRAIKEKSKLVVFSDATVAGSTADDFRFSVTDFTANWEM